MTLIAFSTAENTDTSEIVDLLEGVLQDARAGNVRSLVIGVVNRQGEPYYSCYGRNELELEGLAARVWRNISDDEEEDSSPTAA